MIFVRDIIIAVDDVAVLDTCKSDAMWTILVCLILSLRSLYLSHLTRDVILFCSFVWRESVAPMENEYEVNSVSLEMMDRDAEEASAAESQNESSSLSNSLESGLTVEISRGGDAADSKKLDECGGWTNEKHNSYIDSLEKTFVRQLYSLLGRGETQRLNRTRGVQSNSRKLTDQFTVLQNGYRQKVSFGNKRAHMETMGTAVQGNLLCNDQIKSSGDKGFARTSMRNSLEHEYQAQTTLTAEASGQNFREEEVEEKGCNNSEASRKRRRGANFDDSSLNDQVVP